MERRSLRNLKSLPYKMEDKNTQAFLALVKAGLFPVNGLQFSDKGFENVDWDEVYRMSGLGTEVNERHELAEKALPNVRIRNLVVNLTEGADYLYLFYTKLSAKNVKGLEYLSDITIDGMTVVEDGKMVMKNVRGLKQ